MQDVGRATEKNRLVPSRTLIMRQSYESHLVADGLSGLESGGVFATLQRIAHVNYAFAVVVGRRCA